MDLRRAVPSLGLLFALLMSGSPLYGQCVSLTTTGIAYTQDFNTLANSGTSSTTPPGWYFSELGTNANAEYRAGIGDSNTGDTYSFGATSSPERAFGGLQSGSLNPLIGACFTNNTGGPITSLDIAYTGEQWRIGNTAAARDDRLDFQYSVSADTTSLTTGTWTNFDALDFVNPIKTALAAGALDGNDSANSASMSDTIGSLSIGNGATFWIRWEDFNAASNDDGMAVDNFSLTPQGGSASLTLNISDYAQAEGNAGSVGFVFVVTLNSPAGPGGVTFDIATADGTAQDDNPVTEDNDYVAISLTNQTIPAGSAGPFNFSVTVNGDTNVEPNEPFFVNVTNITGADPGDTQGLGTILNDDVTITPIHDIQGPGESSPILGANVTTHGIVTGVRYNGFFIQEPDATVDADPATSEGIFVFTSGAPPATAVDGASVQVTGTVSEYVPGADPLQPPLTEITSPIVVQLSTGNPLPAPTPLTASLPDPAGPHDQLERLEGMRVSVASLTVIGPTLGSLNEANASSTSTGVFYGVVTSVPRPFREAGIQAPDPAPSGGGTIPPIPRFDSNPERIRVDSDGLIGGPLIDVNSGAVVTGLIGPLDYTYRTYTILPEPGATIGVIGGATATSVAAPTGQEFTVASYNVGRFYDTVNDPAKNDVTLTPTAFNQRLGKASLAIRNNLQMPDIVAIQEMENLTTLQALASQISTDAIAASQPDPLYVASLVEGYDFGGIDVGFLVKTAMVVGSTPRVEVVEVQQELADTLFLNPDSSPERLFDRPPLRLNALIHHPNGASFPITVIVNHLQSLGSVNSESPGSNGWPTVGARVRAKRQRQAEELAKLVQARQTGDPSEHILLVGDFNAYEVNDGLGHSMGVIAGTPAPDNETAIPGDGVDLVNPDFVNLFDSPPLAERYGYVYDGNAQNLDHALVNTPLVSDTTAHRLEHARINADFAETARNDGTTPVRLSDHDPLVVYFTAPAFATADLAISQSVSPNPVNAGADLTYTITVTNTGPSDAANATLTGTIPTGTTFVSLIAPAGWTCTTPSVGATGPVACMNDSLAPGVSAVFPLIVKVTAATPSGTIIANTATVASSTSDPSTGNDSTTVTAGVQSPATLSATKGVTSPSGTFSPGSLITYTIVLTNDGPSTQQDNAGDELVDVLPSSLNLVSAAATQGSVVATIATNTVTWNGSLVAGDLVTITIQARIGSVAEGTTIENQATAHFDTDGDGSNEATAPTDNPSDPGDSDSTTIVVGPAEVPIPTLSPWALLALAALLALMAKLKRYRVR